LLQSNWCPISVALLKQNVFKFHTTFYLLLRNKNKVTELNDDDGIFSGNPTTLEAIWKEQSEICDLISEYGNGGAFEKYLTEENLMNNFINAFNAKNRIVCIDEGTPNGIHLAGSGILYILDEEKDTYDWSDIETGLETAAKITQRADELYGIDEISYHDHCGAAEIVFGKMHSSIKSLFNNDSDDFGRYFSEQLAEILGKEAIHIPLERPEDKHYAKCVIYDATGHYNAQGNKGIPQGLIISRKYLSEEQALNETEVALDIATGPHGPGADKIRLIIIGNSDNNLSLDDMKNELSEILPKYGDSVILDGIMAPKSNRAYM